MSNSRSVGYDVGTSFIQMAEKAEDNSISMKIIRNAFCEMDLTEDTEEMFKRNGWLYIKDGDKVYIPGEDAVKVARFLPNKVEIRRPMADGVLNKDEPKKMLVLDYIVGSTIGKAPDNKSVVCTCISSPAADGSQDSSFHKMRLEAMFKSRGWNVKVIEEGLAVILSERPTVTEIVDGVEKSAPYSGLGMSFGGGRCNCVLAYKGVQVFGASVSRSGDYIDKMVAEATGRPISQVTFFKEKYLDFANLDKAPENDLDIAYAQDVYYDETIKYIFSILGKKFSEVKSQFDYPLDIILAGGTSLIPGFLSKVKKVVADLDLPIKIKDVKMARDPRWAIAEGCLAQAIIFQKKLAEAK